LAAVALVVLIDVYIWQSDQFPWESADLPRSVFGICDEIGHLTTAVLLLTAWRPLRDYPRYLLYGALPAAVLTDLDHIPGELFNSQIFSADTYRPYGHTLLAVLIVAALSFAVRGSRARLVIRGVALGMVLHMLRDMPTGGVTLFWPLTHQTISYPHPIYLSLLLCCAISPGWPRSRARSGSPAGTGEGDRDTIGVGARDARTEGDERSGPAQP
jgi:membrane-bound metal-dependent hydrolase YbcI (DUF457 family)